MVLGDHIHVNKSTVCRVIKRVSKDIALFRPKCINMPNSDDER